ncbi:MAG TPA: TonB-dependent receptor [Chryseolinea sp.]
MKKMIVILFLIPSFSLLAQRRDSVVLREVIVSDTPLFDKETAGGKETKVDSLVLSENLNHTLSELLSENTSVFIKAYGRGSMATASFRGTAPSHTQVLWNGLSINSPMLGMVDFSLLPVYFIDDLKLKHGGASQEDIGGALGGSISMGNHADWNNKQSGRFVQGFGSYNTWEEFGQFNVGNNRFQSKTRAYYTYSKNDFPFINDSKTGAPRERSQHGEYTMYSMMQELYGKINAHNTVSFKGWFHSSDRAIPRLNSFEGPDSANVNTQIDKTVRLHGSWEHHYTSGTVTTSIGANLQDLDYFLRNLVSGDGFQSGVYSQSQSTSIISKVQLDHELSRKASFRFTVNANHHDVTTADSVKKTGYDKSRNELLMFLGYYHTFWSRLNIRASLRQDVIDGKSIPLIPYLGADFKLLPDHNVFLKANITRNYHVPTLNDLYWQPGGNILLRPEHGTTQELTLAWEKNVSGFTIESQLTGYHSNITDWILWVPNIKGYWQPFNVQKVISKGIELTIKTKFQIGKVQFVVNGNYALTRSLNYGDKNTWGDESYGKQLVYIPVHSGNVFAHLRYKKYSFTWQHNAYSTRFTTSSNELSRQDHLPTYFMNQVYAAREFTLGKVTLETQLKVYNLFDEYYNSVLARRMPGRNYMLLLMMRI